MMSDATEDQRELESDDAFRGDVVVRLRFEGPSFAGHDLPLRHVRELEQFGEALQALAKDLWLKGNPDRKRKPKGFSTAFDLRLGQLLRNCVTVELTLPRKGGQIALYLAEGEMHRAAVRACDIVNALDTSAPILPEAPFDALAKLAQFGGRLSDRELVVIDAVGRAGAQYDREKREKLQRALRKTHADTFEVLAGVPDVERSNRHFRFRTVDGRVTRAPLPTDEPTIAKLTKALAQPEAYCVRLFGKAEVSTATGKLIKVTAITRVESCPASHLLRDPDEPAIWEVLPVPSGQGDGQAADAAGCSATLNLKSQRH